MLSSYGLFSRLIIFKYINNTSTDLLANTLQVAITPSKRPHNEYASNLDSRSPVAYRQYICNPLIGVPLRSTGVGFIKTSREHFPHIQMKVWKCITLFKTKSQAYIAIHTGKYMLVCKINVAHFLRVVIFLIGLAWYISRQVHSFD